MTLASAPRHIAIVIYPGFQAIEAFGPMEVFRLANNLAREADRRGYEIELVAREPGPISCTAGVSVLPQRVLAAGEAGDSEGAAIDTLFVSGCDRFVEVVEDRELVAWLQSLAPRVRRLASACTGSFLLAEAGFLNGRRATTHWGAAPIFRQRYPEVTLDIDPIYICDGGVYTSAGLTAGIDLALRLVEEDLGPNIALEVARHLVLYLRRSGGQSQYSAHLQRPFADSNTIAQVQRYIRDNPGSDLSNAALARRAGLSARHFARLFREQVGVTPGKFVQEVRVETARLRLEESNQGVLQIAMACGFGSAETMRRTFIQQLGIAPAEYRQRFHTRRRGRRDGVNLESGAAVDAPMAAFRNALPMFQ